MKAESDPQALPLIISYAGGVLLSDIPEGHDSSQHTEYMVFGNCEDKPWAEQRLPSGMPVFSKDTLITGVVRGVIDKSSALFTC
jgi:hypothetical protein